MMAVHVLAGHNMAALYCSTTDWAFGPVFSDSDDHDAEERAEAFLKWLGARDARTFTDPELQALYSQWLAQEAAQWAEEERVDDDEPDVDTVRPCRICKRPTLAADGVCDRHPRQVRK